MESFEISSDNYDPRSLRDEAPRRPVKPQDTTRQNPRRESPERTARHSATAENRTTEARKNHRQTAAAADSTSSSAGFRWKMFAGVILILAAAYLLIVSISYFRSGAADQSIVDGASYHDIAANASRISNTGGPVGASLSHLLLSRWLGIGSFVLIFYMGALGVSMINLRHFRFWNLTYKCLLCAIVLSILTGFLTYSLTSYNFWGGDHGHYINELIMRHSGIWGALAVNILLVSAVVLVFLKEIQTAWSAYRQRLAKHRQRLARERAEAEARRKKAEEMLGPEPLEGAETQSVPETAAEAEPAHETTASFPRQNEAVLPEETVIPETDRDERLCEPLEEETPEGTEEEESAPGLPLEEPLKEDEVTLAINTGEEIREADKVSTDVYDPTAELSRFRLPSIELLKEREDYTNHVNLSEQEENKNNLTQTLSTYGVKISHIEATVGPTITRYEVIPAEGERIRSIKNLGDDLALKLSALGIRIIAPIPGKGTIGIEVPNKNPQIVGMRSIIASEKFQKCDYDLPIAMGRTISNDIYIADLTKLPHLLVAGATGMGKSVGLNAIIASLLYKKHPAELKFVLIDPKRVELSLYRCLERHYLAALPGEDAIITDTSKVVAVLNSLCIEMGNRLSLLEQAGVRNIKEYNAKFTARRLNPEKHRFLPYIVLIIDEFADIILTAGKDVENPVSRLAAVARAAGIHLILATQRPAVNVITGGIKTNIPGRIAFRTIQSVDSRTILDRTGAEQLVGKGDMIFSRDGVLERVQCAFIDTDEVKAICDNIADQIGYNGPYDLPEFVPAGAAADNSAGGVVTDRDPLFEESGRLVIETGVGSASLLQRKFNIGYPRAGKIIDQLEKAGVVGAAQGGKPRQVLMTPMEFEDYLITAGNNK